jgi:hypothetical protein
MREEATRLRWKRCGIEAIFVDHFADAAQLLYEIGYCRQAGDGYKAVGVRAARLIERAEETLLHVGRPQQEFAARQVALSTLLRQLLDNLLTVALAGAKIPGDEKLGLALWLINAEGTHLTGWAHSDRAHQDPATIAPIEITADNEWVAIQTVCRGARVELDRHTYASRWQFVRGLPLIMDDPSRLVIGCLTLSSTKPASESVLNQMPADRRAAAHQALTETVRAVLAHLGDPNSEE